MNSGYYASFLIAIACSVVHINQANADDLLSPVLEIITSPTSEPTLPPLSRLGELAGAPPCEVEAMKVFENPPESSLGLGAQATWAEYFCETAISCEISINKIKQGEKAFTDCNSCLAASCRSPEQQMRERLSFRSLDEALENEIQKKFLRYQNECLASVGDLCSRFK